MKKNGFHQPENQSSLVKIWYLFKNWPQLITVTVSTQRKNSEQKKRFPLARRSVCENCVLIRAIFGYWEPYWCQEKGFSNKELIFCLVETVFFGRCYFVPSRNNYWNKEKTVLRERTHSFQWKTNFPARGNHFISPFFGDQCQFFFCLVEKYFST